MPVADTRIRSGLAIEVKHARYFNYDSPLKSNKIRMSLMPTRVNRTRHLCRVLALLAGPMLGGLASPLLGAERAQLVLFNGRILTVDPRDTIVQALAIREGKIMAVGADRDILAPRRRRDQAHRFARSNGNARTHRQSCAHCRWWG